MTTACETTVPARREAIRRAMEIDGWLSAREAGMLYDLAKSAKGPIVEIGSWRGRSTAALALGSMAGAGHPVFAIDPFIGVPPTGRPTAQGERPGWQSSSPQILLENLHAAGVNGLVTVMPTGSQQALPFVPVCDVLFVDGDHSFEAASADLSGYMPKVRPGGTMMVHDVGPGDMGVVRAVDAVLMPASEEWTVQQRVDSAVVARRAVYSRRQILLAVPGRGFDFGPVASLLEASRRHDVNAANNANGWDDFNALWAVALNRFEAGECTHFAMLHSDVAPEAGWLDLLMDELEDRQVDLLSTVIPLKDGRGLTSSGIADPEDRWGPYRRFTMKEVADLPPTWSAEDVRHLGAAPELGRHLLHNTGCWVCDLRNPLFRETHDSGCLRCFFDFPTAVRRNPNDGKWQHLRESEDWYFSRKIAQLGAKTAMTRKVSLVHLGGYGFPNTNPWGSYDNDRDTQYKWGNVSPTETTD